MAIVIGETSYISLADADLYMANSYVSTSIEFTTWDALSDGDKEIHLKKATKKIDRQMLRGVKAVDTQTLEFPRALKSCSVYYDNNVVEDSVNQLVLDAQVEEAMAMSITGSSTSNRQTLQQQGVKSFTLGDLSETYGAKLPSSFNSTNLASNTAKELLKYYLAGGVSISC